MKKQDDIQQPTHYQIRLKGHLDARWSDWFDGLALSHQANGTTLLEGPVVDQAALHGLLVRICDLGLPLISIHVIEQTNKEIEK